MAAGSRNSAPGIGSIVSPSRVKRSRSLHQPWLSRVQCQCAASGGRVKREFDAFAWSDGHDRAIYRTK